MDLPYRVVFFWWKLYTKKETFNANPFLIFRNIKKVQCRTNSLPLLPKDFNFQKIENRWLDKKRATLRPNEGGFSREEFTVNQLKIQSNNNGE